MSNNFDILKKLIQYNIEIRHVDFLQNSPVIIHDYHITEKKFQLVSQQLKTCKSIEDIVNNDIFNCVFSKGIYRAQILYELLCDILFFSKTKMTYFSQMHKHNIIAIIIICSQIFGDGNHRTSLFYLINFANMSINNGNNTIKNIEKNRNLLIDCPSLNSEHSAIYESQILLLKHF